MHSPQMGGPEETGDDATKSSPRKSDEAPTAGDAKPQGVDDRDGGPDLQAR